MNYLKRVSTQCYLIGFLITIASVLISCYTTPKIKRNVVNSLEFNSNQEPIIIGLYDSIPPSLTYIGEIASLDKGFTAMCDYETVMTKLKGETKLAGGNLLKITEFNPPNRFSYCYRIKAKIYYAKNAIDLETSNYIENPTLDDAIIHFYRPQGASVVTGKFEILINDSLYFDIDKKTRDSIRIKTEGNYKISVKKSIFSVQLAVKRGREYYIRCIPIVANKIAQKEVVLIDPSTALKEIEDFKK